MTEGSKRNLFATYIRISVGQTRLTGSREGGAEIGGGRFSRLYEVHDLGDLLYDANVAGTLRLAQRVKYLGTVSALESEKFSPRIRDPR
jgi:hypothetical protein